MTYVIPEHVLEGAAKGEYVGIDLDGTTFEYKEWVAWNVFGKVLPPMIERIKIWVSAGVPVRVITARIGLPLAVQEHGLVYSETRSSRCKITGDVYSDAMMQRAIQDRFVQEGLPRFLAQPHKCWRMMELWDDRVIQMVPNTGLTLAEEHEAELSALRGKGFQGASDV